MAIIWIRLSLSAFSACCLVETARVFQLVLTAKTAAISCIMVNASLHVLMEVSPITATALLVHLLASLANFPTTQSSASVAIPASS